MAPRASGLGQLVVATESGDVTYRAHFTAYGRWWGAEPMGLTDSDFATSCMELPSNRQRGRVLMPHCAGSSSQRGRADASAA